MGYNADGKRSGMGEISRECLFFLRLEGRTVFTVGCFTYTYMPVHICVNLVRNSGAEAVTQWERACSACARSLYCQKKKIRVKEKTQN
jgi:hypothetical protein